jgi:hypothetical protein
MKLGRNPSAAGGVFEEVVGSLDVLFLQPSPLGSRFRDAQLEDSSDRIARIVRLRGS